MSEVGKIILLDDEAPIRDAARQTLELEGYEVEDFSNPLEALTQIDELWPGVIVSDVKMPLMDGLEFMRRCLGKDRDLPIVLLTGHGDVAMAVQAMRDGAYDFIEKPFRAEQFLEVIRRALEKRALVLENRALRASLEPEYRIIGVSEPMRQVRKTIHDVADTDVDVLIFGETGTGKEMVARNLHGQSRRRLKPFVAINCGALPESIIESELFGHEAGAFTGAKTRRQGKFEHASGGSLFLDEVESTPPALQIRLLRVLQEREIERLGSNQRIPVDVRLIAATKQDLRELVGRGEFREDLYYRLDVVEIHLPPLRVRTDDIILLFQHFVLNACERYQREPKPLANSMLKQLLAYDWPGNVRELRNIAERYVLFPQADLFKSPSAPASTLDQAASLPEQLSGFEKTLIMRELERQSGDVTATCKQLGIGRKTLYEKMQRLGIDPAEFRA